MGGETFCQEYEERESDLNPKGDPALFMVYGGGGHYSRGEENYAGSVGLAHSGVGVGVCEAYMLLMWACLLSGCLCESVCVCVCVGLQPNPPQASSPLPSPPKY